MAISPATVTISDLHDLLGVDFDTRRAKVYAFTNIPGETVVDTDTGEIWLGGGRASIGSDGSATLEVPTPGTSNPATWQTSVVVDYPDAGSNSRKQRTYGPFTITADADLADLIEEQEVPPEYLTTVTTLLDGYVSDAAGSAADAAASAALAHDISGIATPDALVATLVEDSGSDTSAALSASIDARTFAGYTPELFGAPTTYSSGHDDTTAVQAAIDAAIADGVPMLMRRPYKVTSTVTATGQVSILGTGRFDPFDPAGSMRSGLIANFGNADVLQIDGDGCTLRDFAVHSTAATPTAGAGINLIRAWTAIVDGIAVSNTFLGIWCQDVTYATFSKNLLIDPVDCCALLDNATHVDYGDVHMSDNWYLTFNKNRSVPAAVKWRRGGGLSSVGNKCNGVAGIPQLGSFQVGLDVNAQDGVATSEIKSLGDTWSWCTDTLIKVQTTASGVVGKVIIDNCIGLGAGTTAKAVYISAPTYAEANNLRTVTIGAGNTWSNVRGGGITAKFCRDINIAKQQWSEIDTMSGPLITLGDTTPARPFPINVDIEKQALGYNMSGGTIDGIDIVKDYRAPGNNGVFAGTIDHDYTRDVYITDTAAHAQCTIDLNSNGSLYDGASGIMDMTLSGGTDSSGGPCFIKQARRFVVSTGSYVTVATEGTDAADGPQASHVTITWDNSTTPGKVTLKVTIDNTSGGNPFKGQMRVKFRGTAYIFHWGA